MNALPCEMEDETRQLTETTPRQVLQRSHGYSMLFILGQMGVDRRSSLLRRHIRSGGMSRLQLALTSCIVMPTQGLQTTYLLRIGQAIDDLS